MRSLHIVNGFENPLENKPRIQLVLRGIKRLSGNPRRMRCPITPELLLVIRSRLNLRFYDHCLLWASCCIAFFGFVRAGEFTVTPTRCSSDCLQLSDVSADVLPYPSFLRLFIKVSKADPFRQSCSFNKCESFAVELCKTRTTAILSHWNKIFCWAQNFPQTQAAKTIGTSSKMVMSGNSGNPGQRKANDEFSKMAPQPMPEAASDEISKFGKGADEPIKKNSSHSNH